LLSRRRKIFMLQPVSLIVNSCSCQISQLNQLYYSILLFLDFSLLIWLLWFYLFFCFDLFFFQNKSKDKTKVFRDNFFYFLIQLMKKMEHLNTFISKRICQRKSCKIGMTYFSYLFKKLSKKECNTWFTWETTMPYVFFFPLKVELKSTNRYTSWNLKVKICQLKWWNHT
jgi:hypothetical protein